MEGFFFSVENVGHVDLFYVGDIPEYMGTFVTPQKKVQMWLMGDRKMLVLFCSE